MSLTTILITGGAGLVGTRLTELLISKGYSVSHLSRKSEEGNSAVKHFTWNPAEGFLDKEALKTADFIIHLAGANVAEKAWTAKRKKEIIDSRVKSCELLHDMLKSVSHHIKGFISSSAIGIYGNTGDTEIDETVVIGNDFLAETCRLWEEAVDKIEGLSIRTVKIRIGQVLSKNGGALPQLALPVRLGIGSKYGSGNQYISWIHIDDLCEIFIKAIEDSTMHGPYNAVAPEPARNREMIKAIARTFGRPLFFPPIPAILLKIILGERAAIVLDGNKVSSKKIIAAGFNFKYPGLHAALENIYRSKQD